MYIVESLPSPYYEERAAAEAEARKRLAEQQKQAALKAQAQAPTAAQQSSPSSLGQALCQQRPPYDRASSGLLGNIFQGFAKRASTTPSPAACTPATTPPRSATPSSAPVPTAQQKREMEAQIAERIKSIDRYAVPGWY